MTLAHERTSQFFEGVRRKRREIITPEGVPITVELADYGERLSAFFLDFMLQFIAIIVIILSVVFVAANGGVGSDLTGGIAVAPAVGKPLLAGQVGPAMRGVETRIAVDTNSSGAPAGVVARASAPISAAKSAWRRSGLQVSRLHHPEP